MYRCLVKEGRNAAYQRRYLLHLILLCSQSLLWHLLAVRRDRADLAIEGMPESPVFGQLVLVLSLRYWKNGKKIINKTNRCAKRKENRNSHLITFFSLSPNPNAPKSTFSKNSATAIRLIVQ